MKITGRTHIMFILSDPVDHIRGSDILNRQFAAAGDDVAVSPLHVAPKNLTTIVSAIRSMRNVAGFGVTIPHKVEAVPLLDDLTESARLVGAVNFVRRGADGSLTGENVDVAGFIAGLAADEISVDGASVLQLGAGGAGRAVAFAVAAAGAQRLRIHNRRHESADQLVSAVSAAYPSCDVVSANADPRGVDLIINTTSLGDAPRRPLACGRLEDDGRRRGRRDRHPTADDPAPQGRRRSRHADLLRPIHARRAVRSRALVPVAGRWAGRSRLTRYCRISRPQVRPTGPGRPARRSR